MRIDDDGSDDVDLLDAAGAVISLDDPEWSDADHQRGMDEEGGNLFGGDTEIPFDPFALNDAEAEFWADDADGFEVEGDPNVASPDTYTPAIDEGDFLDPAQRFLFKRLKQAIRDACNVNSKVVDRTRALEWIFVPETRDKDSLQFDMSCRALGARPVIVRARTMHQLWKANIMLSAPLPFLAAIPPQSLMSEIDARIGPGVPGDLAREIWYWPSIPAESLRAKFADVPDRAYHAAMTSLDALGYTAIAFGRVYFISRNPTIMAISGRNRFEFAVSIYGDH